VAGAKASKARRAARAREQWSKALELLPRQSSQAEWIRNHSQSLGRYVDAPTADRAKYKWAASWVLWLRLQSRGKGQGSIRIFKLSSS